MEGEREIQREKKTEREREKHTLKMVAWKISKSSGVRISVANSRAMPLAL
jgi:hypothetical protein